MPLRHNAGPLSLRFEATACGVPRVWQVRHVESVRNDWAFVRGSEASGGVGLRSGRMGSRARLRVRMKAG